MINPDEIKTIYSGGSSDTPARDYVIIGGTSSTDQRDYVILFINKLSAESSTIGIVGYGNNWYDKYKAQLQVSLVSIGSSSQDIWGIGSEVIQLSSSIAGLSYQRAVDVNTGTILVRSGSLNTWELISSSIEIRSSTSNLLYNRKLELLTSVISVISQIGDYGGLQAAICSIGSGSGNLVYNRIAEIATSVIEIRGETQDSFTLQSDSVKIKSAVVTLLYQRITEINVANILVTGGSQDLWGLANSQVTIASSISTFLADRKRQHNTFVLGVNSPQANIIPITLLAGSVNINSNDTIFGFQYLLKATRSTVYAKSFAADFKNSSLVALYSELSLLGRYAEFRRIPSGYLPVIPPTLRKFTPPQHGITKIYTMGGRASRNLMCSKPSNATLSLEYENISDYDAAQVVSAYEDSFGTTYGFILPDAVLNGSDNNIMEYIKLTNSDLKWYFDNKPITRSIIRGVSSLTVQLKAKPRRK